MPLLITRTSVIMIESEDTNMSMHNDTNERETVRPIPGHIQFRSLAQYMAEHMCPIQQATRATLDTPACPPSGVGSDRETLPPSSY